MWQFELQLTASPPWDDDNMREEVTGAYLELQAREDVVFAEMSAALGEGCATFGLFLEVESREEAVLLGVSAIRAALHAQGAQTPGWDDMVDQWIRGSAQTSRPVDDTKPERRVHALA